MWKNGQIKERELGLLGQINRVKVTRKYTGETSGTKGHFNKVCVCVLILVQLSISGLLRIALLIVLQERGKFMPCFAGRAEGFSYIPCFSISFSSK